MTLGTLHTKLKWQKALRAINDKLISTILLVYHQTNKKATIKKKKIIFCKLFDKKNSPKSMHPHQLSENKIPKAKGETIISEKFQKMSNKTTMRHP